MKNNTIEKHIKTIKLFDFYSNLLTEKQRKYFEYYYFENYTLKEIADLFSITKSAVGDNINKINQHLLEYESKLSLLKKYKQTSKLIKSINNKEIEKKWKEIEGK